jgi:hypothetical protein
MSWRISLLRDPRGVVRHVRFESPSEAATDDLVVDRHLCLRPVRGLRYRGLHTRHHLRSSPCFRGSRRDVHGAVQRLQGCVREQRHLVLGRHDAALLEDIVDTAFILRDGAVTLACAAQP